MGNNMFKKYQGDVLDAVNLAIYLNDVQKMIDRLHLFVNGL